MFLTHNFNIIKHQLYKSTSLWSALLVVGLYLCILHFWSNSQHEHSSSQSLVHQLKPIDHVILKQVPTHKSSAFQVMQTGGTEPVKFFSFDDFMKTYAGNSVQNKSEINQPEPATSPTTTSEISLFGPSIEPTVQQQKSSLPVKTVSAPANSASVINNPADNDFSAFMQSQTKGNITIPDSNQSESAKMLINNLQTDDTIPSQAKFDQNLTESKPFFDDKSTAPKLLIAETARSLDLPKTVVNEIARVESTSPGGLQPLQVRKLIAMMINEAAELNDSNQKEAATRLAKFALFVADEASLTAIKNDPELTSLLYLGRTMSATVSNQLPSSFPLTQPALAPIQENSNSTLLNPVLPEIAPQQMPKISQQAKANESMVLPGYTPTIQTSYMQHPVNHLTANSNGNNPFQSATYTNERNQINQSKNAFQPFDSAPHNSNQLPAVTNSRSKTDYLAFPQTEAPLPPVDNMASATTVFNQEMKMDNHGITVKDQLVEIPEHISYGVMLGMFLMIILLLFRRR